MMAAGGRLARKLELLHHPDLSQSLTAFVSMPELRAAHAHAITTGHALDPFTISRLIAFCAVSASGDLRYAEALFASVRLPRLSMYTSLIRGFSRSEEPAKGVHLYVRMIRSGVTPDRFTFPFLIRSCALSGSIALGESLHCHIVKFGLEEDVFVVNNAIAMYSGLEDIGSARRLFEQCIHIADVVSWTSIVRGYVNSGQVDTARWYFDRMPAKNVISWNTMIGGYARGRRTDEARQLFDVMPERNAASWGALISGYAQSGLCKESLATFKEMLSTGVAPNEPVLVSAVSACAQMRALDEGERLHRCIEERQLELSVTMGSALIDMYGRCGSISRAVQLFDKMPTRNVYTWNSIISGLAMNGHERIAMALFWKMLESGLAPNGITFLGLLSACSHSGLVAEGQKFFELMTMGYGIRPFPEHYGCMVDLLGRAGLIKEALDFVESMPVEPHAGLLGALVGACRIHGHAQLGEKLGKKLIEIEPHHAGRYALLANLYASARRWDDVAMVGKLLRERRVVKAPGKSAVEAG